MRVKMTMKRIDRYSLNSKFSETCEHSFPENIFLMKELDKLT